MTARSRGRTGLTPLWNPRQQYLLDNQLNPYLAAAFQLAGWDIKSVQEWFGVDPEESVLDEVIIPRCGSEGRVWVTADERAQRRHEAALKLHRVSVLWIIRPNDGMSTAYQHAHIATALLRVDYDLSHRPSEAVHYEVGWTLKAEPKEVWKSRRTRGAPR